MSKIRDLAISIMLLVFYKWKNFLCISRHDFILSISHTKKKTNRKILDIFFSLYTYYELFMINTNFMGLPEYLLSFMMALAISCVFAAYCTNTSHLNVSTVYLSYIYSDECICSYFRLQYMFLVFGNIC